MSYQTYKWAFKSRVLKTKMIIYAREEETAKKIIAVYNTFSNYNFKPTRFGYKKPVSVNYPPYATEQRELEDAEEALKERKWFVQQYPEEYGSYLANDDGTL